MNTLPNGCRCSDINVSPSGWDKKGASTKKAWKIHYRFYDPQHEKPYQVVIKAGINQIKDLDERRAVVKELIRNEYVKLKSEGFNPITGAFLPTVDIATDISPDTPFIPALRKALDKIDAVEDTKKDIRCVIRGVEKAASQLQLLTIPIYQVSRKHVKIILEQCWKSNQHWTPRRYNAYRSYLIMLFTELLEEEAVSVNPIWDIKKKKETKKLRTVLTDKQREKIDSHLKKVDYRFWLFIHIFFHSGGRLKELTQLKLSDVDLVNQIYKAVIRKGRTYKEVERTIKDVALPYWKEYVENAQKDDFLFGIDFLPSKKPMVPNTITRRWKKWVKDGLGISVDLYSLKHLNTAETVTHAGDEVAAKQNAHTSTAMVRNTYDVHRNERQHKILKSVNNKFA